VAAALVLVGCGASEDPGRAPYERYVESVNAIQKGYADDFAAANTAYIALSRSELKPAPAMAALSKAEIEIRGARDKVAALEPPASAAELHKRYLAYMDSNVSFASENAKLAVYLEGSDQALAPLDRANSRLRHALRRAKTPARQERALEAFAASVRAALVDVRTLDAPAVLRGAPGEQVKRLATTYSLALKLRDAMADRDSQRVASLLVKFRRSAAARGRTRMAAAAIKRYMRRYEGLSEAYTQIRREETRLRRRFA
jgi:hypothetical protein